MEPTQNRAVPAQRGPFASLMLAVVLVCAGWPLSWSGCGQDPAPVTSDWEVTNLAGDWRGEVIYQLLVDRFGNGDINNDHNVVPGVLGRYQGGDWQGVIDHIDYLVGLGVTAVWISPVVRNVESDAGFDGYHGYWTQDFLDVNPHFGDIAKLREMVQVLHEHGILVILDIVANHVGQVFYYDINQNGQPDDFLIGQGDSSPLTRITEYDPDFDIRGVQAVTGLGESGDAPIEWVVIPELNRGPTEPPEFANPDWYWRRGRVTVWGREWEACQEVGIDPSSDWDSCHAYIREQELTGDFPGGLKDLRTELPEVREALIRVLTYWIDAIDIDGFRIDTVKHVEHEFWEEFGIAVRQYAHDVGKDNFFMFGEAFDGNDELLGSFTQPNMLDSVFYFSQYFVAFGDVFKWGGPTARVEELWQARQNNYNTSPQPMGPTDADGNGIPPTQLLVNFLDNHDVSRFLYEQPDVGRLYSSLMLQFTENGIPCIYYGTEQGMSGGNDPANRQPLWEVGYDTNHPTYQFISQLAAARRGYPELMFGTQHLHWSTWRTGDEQDAGILAFERRYRGLRAMVVLNTNSEQASQTSAETLGFGRMTTTFSPGTVLVDVMPGSDGSTFTVGDEGCDVVACQQPVPDDYTGAACGCLLVEVAPLGGRILVEQTRLQ